MKRYLVILLFLSGCDSPMQGKGALYIHDHGEHICVEVDSVHFWSSRHTEYKVKGKSYSTEVTPEFYEGQKCKSSY